jgi:hypothetical protein
MPRHRKIPPVLFPVKQIESELLGEIVLFRFKPDTLSVFTFRPQNKYISDESHSLILKVYSVAPYTNDTGKGLLIEAVYVAGEVYTSQRLFFDDKNISEYKILTVKDLPLYIGLPHKSPLFDKLLKGKAV